MNLAQACGAHSPAREAACAALLRRVQEQGVKQVRVFWADLHGSFRSKTLLTAGGALKSALQDGLGMVSTLLLKDSADHTAFPVFDPEQMARLPVGLAEFRSANNLLLLPDPSSFVLLPWATDTAWLRAEPLWPDGRPVQADPRQVLQRALAQLAQLAQFPQPAPSAHSAHSAHSAPMGLGLKCGLEVEFHIYKITDAALALDQAAWPAEAPAVQLLHPGYQLLSDSYADLCEPALAIVRDTALGLGLPLQSLEIEFGPSQFEAVFAATDALTAADQMLLFRNGVRQALRRAGYLASFVCKPPMPHAVASGWHLHQSLVDAQGRNVMASIEDNVSSDLSNTGQHWLAGLLAHAQGMTALCAPTLPAYSRYQGGVMAPQYANWGPDSRGTMLRVLRSPVGSAGGNSTRIENRLPEPLANPYLMVAAQVFAGLDGLAQKRLPGPAADAPHAATQVALPQDLAAALQALAHSPVMQQGLGADMAEVFSTIKHQELQRHAQAEDKALWLRREYFGRF
jgi:glutamine synthetase